MLQKLRSRLPELHLPRWDGRLSPAGWQVISFFAGVLAGGGSLFGVLHPFGLALVLGLQPQLVFSAAAGTALGHLWLLEPVTAMRYLGAVAAALGGRWLGSRRFWPGAVAGCSCLLLVQLLLSLSGLSSLSDALAALGDAALAVVLGLAVRQRQAGSTGVQLASVVGLMMGVASLQRFGAGAIQPGLVLYGAVGLALARRGRVREVSVLCIALSAALMAASPSLAYAAVGVAAGCVLAAAFAPGEALGGSALFLVGCLPGMLAAPGALSALRFLGSVAAIEITAWLIPRGAVAAVEGAMPPETSQKPTLAGAAGRLNAVGQALSDIADTVNAVCEKLPPRGENYNWVVEQVVRELCRGCAQCQDCWVQNYSTTVDGFFIIKNSLEQEGRVGVEQLPGQLCRCIHPAELCGACGRAWALYRGRRETRVQAGILRAAVTEQYSAVAGALAQLAEDLGRDTRLDPGKSGRVADFFAGIGLEPLETAVTLDTMDRMEVRVTVNRTAFSQEEQGQLAEEVGRICRRRLTLPALNHCRTVTSLVFAEQPVYCPVFAAASLPAQAGQPCGDAAENFCDSFGAAHLLLCDGMGTGKAAAVDGSMAANLTGRLLRAGFAGDAAARLVNVALSLKSEEEGGATLDLLSVDLYTGRADLYKAGAAPSFLVRGSAVRSINGNSLPVGIMAHVVGGSQQFDLMEGDWVVLLSDGALAEGEEWVIQQLQICSQVGNTPQETADLLVEMARKRVQSNQKPDDVTAAVFQLTRSAR